MLPERAASATGTQEAQTAPLAPAELEQGEPPMFGVVHRVNTHAGALASTMGPSLIAGARVPHVQHLRVVSPHATAANAISPVG
jgi:hypothetical protein